MRVLVIGAGIAGLSLAGLLRLQGIDVTLIERSKDFEHAGYGVGIYPVALPVFEALGLLSDFMKVAIPYRSCALHDASGAVVDEFDMRTAFGEFGEAVGVRRPDLVEVLFHGIGDVPIRFATTAIRLIDRGDAVQAEFSDETAGSFDMVVGADGANSSTRLAMLSRDDSTETDSGWSAVYLLLDGDGSERGAIHEYYGNDHIAGMYPVRGGWLGGLAAQREAISGASGEQLAAFLRARWNASLGGIAGMATALEHNVARFYAELRDSRCSRWVSGRLALVGDAACSFIPSAGLGSTMALLAAAAVVREVQQTRSIADALRQYERLQRPSTEAAQQQSRELANAMFGDRARPYRPSAFARDALRLMRMTSQAAR